MYRDLGFSVNGLEVEGFRRGFWFGVGGLGLYGMVFLQVCWARIILKEQVSDFRREAPADN